MIDDLAGRPSYKVKKYQVYLVFVFWLSVLIKGPRHGPKFISKISFILTKRLTAWQIYVLSMTGYYIFKNVDKILNFQPPSLLSKDVYTRNFYRVCWLLNATDAGFWTAMNIKKKWLRDILSIFFSVYYLVFTEQATNKNRLYQSNLTINLIRVSLNKFENPYIKAASWFLIPKVILKQGILIQRPDHSIYSNPIQSFLWFNSNKSDLSKAKKILLFIHGGGFISMTPLEYEPILASYAKRFQIPIVAINYEKAPEYPYPYALDECFDAYRTIINTRGKCIGLSGNKVPEICLMGDSAGGNLATGIMLRLLTTKNCEDLPKPNGLLLIYPSLALDYTCCLSPNEIKLIQKESIVEEKPELYNQKTEAFGRISSFIKSNHNTIINLKDMMNYSSIRISTNSNDAYAYENSNDYGQLHSRNSSFNDSPMGIASRPIASLPIKSDTGLQITSKIAYSNDRILYPELLRAILLLYIGTPTTTLSAAAGIESEKSVNKSKSIDLNTDFFLSPVLTPLSLLAKFPKVCILVGEADPLVDDSVIFAAKLREAKNIYKQENKNNNKGMGIDKDKDKDVEIQVIKGLSHGFYQMGSMLPELDIAKTQIDIWIENFLHLIDDDDTKEEEFKEHHNENTIENHHLNAFQILLEKIKNEIAERFFSSTLKQTKPASLSTCTTPQDININNTHDHKQIQQIDALLNDYKHDQHTNTTGRMSPLTLGSSHMSQYPSIASSIINSTGTGSDSEGIPSPTSITKTSPYLTPITNIVHTFLQGDLLHNSTNQKLKRKLKRQAQAELFKQITYKGTAEVITNRTANSMEGLVGTPEE